ncbi:MAG TPA: hypothetical protein DER09_08405 [Prolixibacteraceae bacterium]|nr:hypothetical protein [Prolixibacteraceae bacterium]
MTEFEIKTLNQVQGDVIIYIVSWNVMPNSFRHLPVISSLCRKICFWVNPRNDIKPLQCCHFDEYARRNLFEQADFSFVEMKRKKNLSLEAK